MIEHEGDASRRESAVSSTLLERLAAVDRCLLAGSLLSMLRHEVNNMLMRIGGNLQLLEREALPPTAQSIASEARAASDALARLLESIPTLSDTTTEPRCTADHLIDTVLRLITPVINERHIQIVPHTVPMLELPLPLHEAQHVLLHLIMNSVEALAADDQNEHTIWVNIVAWDATIVLTVRDTGPGVPDAIRAHIFDPFVSTKTSGGSGLGLAIVRSILQHAGGDVALTDTRPGHTTFTAWLPRRSLDGSTATL